jgi:DNA-entry nuclease
MEAWSVEDDGSGVCFNVYCYNVQPGIEIDYATGDSWESANNSTDGIDDGTVDSSTGGIDDGTVNNSTDDGIDDGIVDSSTGGVDDESGNNSTGETDNETRDYILNKNTKKIHLPDCSSVDEMAEKNKVPYNGTIEEIEQQGYSPCKRCLE